MSLGLFKNHTRGSILDSLKFNELKCGLLMRRELQESMRDEMKAWMRRSQAHLVNEERMEEMLRR